MKTAGRPFSCPASSANFLLLTRLQCTPNAFSIRAMLGFATLTRIERFLTAQHALRFGLSEEAWQHSLVVYPSPLDTGTFPFGNFSCRKTCDTTSKCRDESRHKNARVQLRSPARPRPYITLKVCTMVLSCVF